MLLVLTPSGAVAQTSTSYAYDALGRLVKKQDTTEQITQRSIYYSYDPAGNRTDIANSLDGVRELAVSSFTPSSDSGLGTGLTPTGMADGRVAAANTVFVTQSETAAWIKADLGSAQPVGSIDIAAASLTASGIGADNTNSSVIEYFDGTNWVYAATISTVQANAYLTINIGGITAQYWRIRRTASGQLGLGEFRFFSGPRPPRAPSGGPMTASAVGFTLAPGGLVTFHPLDNVVGGSAPLSLLPLATSTAGGGVVYMPDAVTVNYTAPASGVSSDQLTYTAQDATGATVMGTVNFAINPGSTESGTDYPFAVAMEEKTAPGHTITFNPLNFALDTYGQPLQIISLDQPAVPQNTISKDPVTGAITYTPWQYWAGDEYLKYTVQNPSGRTSSAVIHIAVASDIPPVANPDAISARPGLPVTFDPRTNDSDANGDPLTIVAVGPAGHGTVTINGGTSVTYTDQAGYLGPDSFSYTISDGQGGSATATVSVTDRLNLPPVAVDDVVTVPAGGPFTFDPRVNDSDPDNDPLTIIAIGTPSHGTAALQAGLAIIYTPAAGYTGPDSLTYEISDGQGGTAQATVTITVSPDAVEYLVVAGGGAGGVYNPYGTNVLTGGGGGGGGVRSGVMLLPPATYTMTVGAGGAGGTNGGNSSVGTLITAIGGGAGGQAGGSGAGGPGGPGGAGTPGQGYPGGAGTANSLTAQGSYGGGGGAGGPGRASIPEAPGNQATAPGQGGGGGPGISSSISGTTTTYAAGGGAGAFSYTDVTGYHAEYAGAAGDSSAQAGGSAPTYDVPSAPPNRGGGGGSPGYDAGAGIQGEGGAGGSGVIILRYQGPARPYGGTVTQVGGYTIHTFTATTAVTVPTNRAPFAANDVINVRPGFSRTFDPRVNDSDPDGDPLFVLSVSAPANGVASAAADGTSVTYTPNAGYLGADSFTYIVSDGRGGTAIGTVSVTVRSNSAPTAVDDAISASAGWPLTFDPRLNDTDPEGDALSITFLGTSPNSLTHLNPDGTVTYTANPGFTGADSFTYTISDGQDGTATATVHVTVAPEVRVFTISPAVNGKTTWNLDIDGTLSLPTAGTWTLTPQANFVAQAKAWGAGGAGWTNSAGGGGGYAGGLVQFQANVAYRLDVGIGGGVATIQSGGAPGGGSGGVYQNQSFGGGGGGFSGLRKSLSNAAVLIAGGGGGGGSAGGGAGGGLSGQPGGSLGLINNPNFPYYAGGTAGTQTSGGSPFMAGNGGGAAGGGGGGYYGGGGGGGDGQGDGTGGGGGSGYALSSDVTSAVLAAGNASAPANGADPDRGGAASGGAASSGAAGAPGEVILVGVSNSNTAPVAYNDSVSTTWLAAKTFDPRENDYDPNGDTLTITTIGPAAHGTATLNGGASVTYTPTPNYVGTDSFTYAISDGRGGTASATITVAVTAPTNTAPTAANANESVRVNHAVTFDPRTADSDIELNPLTISAITAPANGVATIASGGTSITYTPTGGYIGPDTFTYTVSDGHGGATTAGVFVTVYPNTAPVAVDDTVAATAAVSFDPRTNDSDVDGDPLTVISVTQPTHGTASVVTGGAAVSYTPISGYVGQDSFTYTISDGQGGTGTATIRVNSAIDYLMVGGGGGGGGDAATGVVNQAAGGGGAGGMKTGSFTLTDGVTSFSVVVGAGGTIDSGNGGSSSLGGSLAVSGGGGGGSYGGSGLDGGSGGGAGARSSVGQVTLAGRGIPGQGNDGGAGSGAGVTGAGGGAGSAGTTNNAGSGLASGITGTSAYYAGLSVGSASNSGFGIGGHGASYYVASSAGTGGVVIIRYPTGTMTAVGGTITQAGGYTIHTFTANGTFTRNSMPVAVNDVIVARGSAVTFDPRINDSDPDGDALTVYSVTSPTHGTAVIGGGGTQITYTPLAGYIGPDGFNYTVRDARGGMAGAAVSVITNHAPVAANDNITAVAGVAFTFDPRTNDMDADGDPLTVATVTVPPHGTAAITGAGASITYTPSAGYSGSDTFNYSISDGQGGSASASVNVTVTPARTFTISPAVGGVTTWNIDVNGPLNLGTSGTWTITPQNTFSVQAKAWGAGGGAASNAGAGGGGGYAAGTIQLQAGVAYRIDVGAGGTNGAGGGAGGAPGGGGGSSGSWEFPGYGGGGGGFTGLRKSSGAAVLIAGAGGGGDGSYAGVGGGGAGGGASGSAGASPPDGHTTGGAGGTQTTGAAQFAGSAASTSTIGQAGGGGGGYYGGFGGANVAYWDDDISFTVTSSSAGGGGSGYVSSSDVTSGVLTAASGATPGNSGDSDRGGAGSASTTASGSAGRIILKGS
ncbi:Ig-like domain-containing protein [Phenylobacterium sp.]|uniref:Ig-like domain-containing protein n=1 Tax=Phenylobacterium sp. TaxID=1871053 RepID=UPI002D195C61|nr:Ig-like domain-containing protein [Phenylobacterium sp.]HLZ77169.1 Ig-like domain-containing protein [Phenylobacterium sp.]